MYVCVHINIYIYTYIYGILRGFFSCLASTKHLSKIGSICATSGQTGFQILSFIRVQRKLPRKIKILGWDTIFLKSFLK